jgi:hypothetical protein
MERSQQVPFQGGDIACTWLLYLIKGMIYSLFGTAVDVF